MSKRNTVKDSYFKYVIENWEKKKILKIKRNLKKKERSKKNVKYEFHLWSYASWNSNRESKILRSYCWKDFNKYIESTKIDGETLRNT